jgi:hypothetical protein
MKNMSDIALNQVVELALKLTISEQAKLLERVAAHLALEVEAPLPDVNENLDWTEEELAELLKPGTPKTGTEIAAMLTSGELSTSSWSEMLNPHITDPVEWIKALRRDAARQRKLDWDSE